ncbi:water dikinase 2, Selenide [Lucilia cuprina]|nr:water dikinase 2, Selenide [Lucilia cuprina]
MRIGSSAADTLILTKPRKEKAEYIRFFFRNSIAACSILKLEEAFSVLSSVIDTAVDTDEQSTDLPEYPPALTSRKDMGYTKLDANIDGGLRRSDKGRWKPKYLGDFEIFLKLFPIDQKTAIPPHPWAAQLMHKYKANAATDVTGFGLLGHAQNLAEFQKGCLKFVINKIPVFKNILSFGKILNQDVKLRAGKSVETSGGLLISIPSEYSNQFCQEFNNITNGEQLAWIVGYVKKSDKREAILCEETDIFEIDFSNS